MLPKQDFDHVQAELPLFEEGGTDAFLDGRDHILFEPAGGFATTMVRVAGEELADEADVGTGGTADNLDAVAHEDIPKLLERKVVFVAGEDEELKGWQGFNDGLTDAPRGVRG